METTYRKHERDGWQARTVADLGPAKDTFGHEGMRQLTVSTSKNTFRRELQASASVSLSMGDHTVHAMGLGTGCGDYSRTILRSGAKCTEKNIRALHVEALMRWDAIMAEARAHYARQEAERAAKHDPRPAMAPDVPPQDVIPDDCISRAMT
jgi:hypothetical protein